MSVGDFFEDLFDDIGQALSPVGSGISNTVGKGIDALDDFLETRIHFESDFLGLDFDTSPEQVAQGVLVGTIAGGVISEVFTGAAAGNAAQLAEFQDEINLATPATDSAFTTAVEASAEQAAGGMFVPSATAAAISSTGYGTPALTAAIAAGNVGITAVDLGSVTTAVGTDAAVIGSSTVGAAAAASTATGAAIATAGGGLVGAVAGVATAGIGAAIGGAVQAKRDEVIGETVTNLAAIGAAIFVLYLLSKGGR